MKAKKFINRSSLILACLFGFLTSNIQAEVVTILQESFETDGLGTRYTVIGGGDNGETDFFARREQFSAGTDASGGTIDGNFFFGASDIDNINRDLPSPDFPGLGRRDGVIIFNDIPVNGFGNLNLQMAVAQGQGTFEPDNHFRIQVRFDDPGDAIASNTEWITIGGFRSTSTNTPGRYFEGPLRLTSEDDPRLVSEFTEWEWPLWGFGTTMDMRLIINSNWRDEDYYIDNIRITGDNEVFRVEASLPSFDLVEPSGPEPIAVTFSSNAPAPAGGLVLEVVNDDWSAFTLELPETITIPEGQSNFTFNTSHIPDGRFTGLKIVEARFRANNVSRESLRFKVENSTPKPRVIIMEVQNVIPGTIEADPEGDANGDGVSDFPGDQFVELVNFEDFDVDISGWTVHDDLGPRHQYPEGTVIPAGRALVTFGGGTPSGVFGGADVLTASSGTTGFAFNSTRAEIAGVFAPFGGEMEIIDLPFEAQILERTLQLPQSSPAFGETASIHRTGDSIDAPFELHPFIPGSNDSLFSPGARPDGSPYFTPTNVVTVDVLADSASETDGAVGAVVTLETPAPAGGLTLNLSSNATDDEITFSAPQITVPAGQTTVQFEILPFNDGVLDGPSEVSIFVTGLDGSDVLGGLDKITIEDVAVNNFRVEVAEFLISLDGTGEDPNLNGNLEEEIADQFIEIVNRSGFPVDLRGWSIVVRVDDAFAVRQLGHTFGGTTLEDNASALVFGEIFNSAAADPIFGGSFVEDATNDDSNGGLHADSGDAAFVDIVNQFGFVVFEVEIPADLTSQGMSVVIENGTPILHLEASGGESIMSPGLQTNGSAYPGN